MKGQKSALRLECLIQKFIKTPPIFIDFNEVESIKKSFASLITVDWLRSKTGWQKLISLQSLWWKKEKLQKPSSTTEF